MLENTANSWNHVTKHQHDQQNSLQTVSWKCRLWDQKIQRLSHQYSRHCTRLSQMKQPWIMKCFIIHIHTFHNILQRKPPNTTTNGITVNTLHGRTAQQYCFLF